MKDYKASIACNTLRAVFSMPIDVGKFLIQNLFSVFNGIFETRLCQQPLVGVESKKNGMKI